MKTENDRASQKPHTLLSTCSAESQCEGNSFITEGYKSALLQEAQECFASKQQLRSTAECTHNPPLREQRRSGPHDWPKEPERIVHVSVVVRRINRLLATSGLYATTPARDRTQQTGNEPSSNSTASADTRIHLALAPLARTRAHAHARTPLKASMGLVTSQRLNAQFKVAHSTHTVSESYRSCTMRNCSSQSGTVMDPEKKLAVDLLKVGTRISYRQAVSV